MDKFYKSLLIPILEPRIEKAIAEAIQDGKWHPTYYFSARCAIAVNPMQAYRKAFAMYGKKRINLYGHTREETFITMGPRSANSPITYRNYQRLGRIDKRGQDLPMTQSGGLKIGNWLAGAPYGEAAMINFDNPGPLNQNKLLLKIFTHRRKNSDPKLVGIT